MAHDWNEHAQSWDQDEAPRAYAAAAFSSLQDLLKSFGATLDNARVLDFGSGTGLLVEHLVSAGAAVHAVDSSPAMLEVLDTKVAQRRWTNVTTSAEIPASETQYDLIACSSVCSFLDDYPGTMTKLVAHLRLGGLFVQWDWERVGDDLHGLSRAEIGGALTAAGLVEVTVKTGFSTTIDEQILAPLMGHGRRPSETD